MSFGVVELRTSKLLCIASLVLLIAITSVSFANGQSDADITDEAAKFIVMDASIYGGIKNPHVSVANGRPNGGEKVLIISYNSEALDLGRLGEETALILGLGWQRQNLAGTVNRYLLLSEILQGKQLLANGIAQKIGQKHMFKGI